MTHSFYPEKRIVIANEQKRNKKMETKLITFISSHNVKLNVHTLCGTKLHIILIKL